MTDFYKCDKCGKWTAQSELNSFCERDKNSSTLISEDLCNDCSLEKLKEENKG